MKIAFAVAVSENNAIGANNDLLWRLPKDMAYFKKTTLGHHVLMGRKSWDSLPAKYRPLDGRTNIIITRQPGFKAEGAIVLPGLQEGIEYARKNGEQELMIIGGGEIFKQSWSMVDRIYLTRVYHTFDNADTFFPAINNNEWKEVFHEHHKADDKHKYDFAFITLDRIK